MSPTPHRVKATYQGKTYERCLLHLDEDARSVRIVALPEPRRSFSLPFKSAPKAEEVEVVRFTYDATTRVAVEDGRVLRVDDSLAVEAEDPSELRRVAEVVGKPASERAAQLRGTLERAEYSVKNLLRTRESAVLFLRRLRTDPRRTMFEAYSSTRAERYPGAEGDTDHVEDLVAPFRDRLSSSLADMSSNLLGVEEGFGAEAANKLYAAAYAVGLLQDALLVPPKRGEDPERLAEGRRLLTLAIGCDERLLADATLETLTDRALDAVHRSLSALGPAHAPRA